LYISQFHETSVLREHQEQEAAWLSLLPKHLQMDLMEEARAKLIVLVPFFHALSLKCHVGVRMLCYEAISSKIAIWPERVFDTGYAAAEVYFVQSGVLAYITDDSDPSDVKVSADGMRSTSSIGAMRSKLQAVRSVTSVLQSKRCISEPALWTTWVHTGDLSSVVNSTLLAFSVQGFARVILHFHVVLPVIVDFGRRYVHAINKVYGDLSDLVNLHVPFKGQLDLYFAYHNHKRSISSSFRTTRKRRARRRL